MAHKVALETSVSQLADDQPEQSADSVEEAVLQAETAGSTMLTEYIDSARESLRAWRQRQLLIAQLKGALQQGTSTTQLSKIIQVCLLSNYKSTNLRLLFFAECIAGDGDASDALLVALGRSSQFPTASQFLMVETSLTRMPGESHSQQGPLYPPTFSTVILPVRATFCSGVIVAFMLTWLLSKHVPVCDCL